ncbi:MAG: glycosyltransferase [Lachnospiraceae bacterium]|nr:glycosyltransferase [Lachnospiraceae bacterium]
MDEYITVAVWCYNSSNTIIETLESIFSQTYRNLNLAINDDYSQDNTIEIVENWIDKHRERFGKIILNYNQENHGISYCFDSLLRLCDTRWVKGIAGDDILMPNCCESNMRYLQENNIDTLVYSECIPFSNCGEQLVINPYNLRYAKELGKMPVEKQYKFLLRRDMPFSPTFFINVERYVMLGGIPLDIRNIEDWPLKLLFSSKGEKIYFMDEKTVLYRVGNSISHSESKLYNEDHIKQRKQLKEKMVYPHIPRYHIVYYGREILDEFRVSFAIKILKNKKNRVTIMIDSFLKICNIFRWREYVMRLIR